jgi:hypothetical protein
MGTRKPKPKVPKTANDKEQSERFIDTAVAFGAEDKDGLLVEQAFRRAVPPRSKSAKEKLR